MGKNVLIDLKACSSGVKTGMLLQRISSMPGSIAAATPVAYNFCINAGTEDYAITRFIESRAALARQLREQPAVPVQPEPADADGTSAIVLGI